MGKILRAATCHFLLLLFYINEHFFPLYLIFLLFCGVNNDGVKVLTLVLCMNAVEYHK